MIKNIYDKTNFSSPLGAGGSSIAAISTAPGIGGIAVIRVSGLEALACVCKDF